MWLKQIFLSDQWFASRSDKEDGDFLAGSQLGMSLTLIFGIGLHHWLGLGSITFGHLFLIVQTSLIGAMLANRFYQHLLPEEHRKNRHEVASRVRVFYFMAWGLLCGVTLFLGLSWLSLQMGWQSIIATFILGFSSLLSMYLLYAHLL